MTDSYRCTNNLAASVGTAMYVETVVLVAVALTSGFVV